METTLPKLETDAGASPAIVAAVNQGMREFLSMCATGSPLVGADLRRLGKHLLYASGLDYAPCNGILAEGPLSQQQLQESTDYFRARNVPFVCWSNQTDLESSGFQFGGVMKGIGLDLSGWQPLQLERLPELEIIAVESGDEMASWSRLVTETFAMAPHVNAQFQQLLEQLAQQQQMVNLLAKWNGVAVATVSLSIGSPIAGLWNGATHPDYRRRGILTALLQTALLEAKQRGQHQAMAILMPKGMARGSCQRIGFCDVNDWPFYVHGATQPLE
jgi:GNAT superfamily N-acetyltransferase